MPPDLFHGPKGVRAIEVLLYVTYYTIMSANAVFHT